MRNEWPHTGDGQGVNPANQGHVPFGPAGSWPSGYSNAEYHNSGGYVHEAPQPPQLPDPGYGAHPYAAFNAAGYGDDGYSDPGYQGPAAQDAGIAGTRTVRGFVEPNRAGRPHGEGAGYASSGYLQAPVPAPDGYGQNYAGPGYAAAGDLYSQPWDYDQPLRYEGEGEARPGARGQQQPASGYDPAAYNGSDYSMPGVDGPGYDLTGIIGTSDFEAFGYDEPSYGRLSYDDPRYQDARNDGPGGYPGSRSRSPETRFDNPRYDETRLDNLWQAGDDVRREAGPAGFGNGPFGNPSSRRRSAPTRADLRALSEPFDSTRFDVPVFDETRLDNLRALTPGGGMRRAGTAVLTPPRDWAADTSLDQFEGLDLTDEPVPAFTRTLDRPRPDDTGARRAAGKRRGRSGDRRQWMALGAIAVVAAGAIGGVMMKYVFSGPSGPAHEVVAPKTVDDYSRSANLEKQMKVSTFSGKVAESTAGQASNVVSAVYEQGSLDGTSSGTQIFMFVGGKLSSANPAASVANFEQSYPGGTSVPAGTLGGDQACSEIHLNGQSESMCVWFDNDTFGTVVSPTMTTAKLATTMDQARPSLELYSK
jgi:hypothetical protein